MALFFRLVFGSASPSKGLLPDTKILCPDGFEVDYTNTFGKYPGYTIFSPLPSSCSMNSLGLIPNFFRKQVLKYFGSLNPTA